MLAAALMKQMREDGIEIVDHAVPAQIRETPEHHELWTADGRILGPFDCVLWAIGREPAVEQLDLALVSWYRSAMM